MRADKYLTKNKIETETKKKSARKKRRAASEGTIFYSEAQGLWVAQISAGLSQRTGKPLKKRKYARSQQEALEQLARMKEKYAVVKNVDADRITLGEWLTKWFEVYAMPKIKENTQQSYRRIINIAIEELGTVKLEKLTDIDLQGIIYGRLKNHFRTAQFFRVIMKAALKKAVKSRLIKESPAEDLELPKRPPKRKFVKPTGEEWKKLLEFDTSCYYCWRWILLTEFVTGARLSELLALKWQDIDIQKDSQGRITGGSLHIQRTLYLGMNDQKGSERPLLEGPTKTEQGNRVLPLPVDFIHELMQYRKVRLERQMLTPCFERNDFIFTQNDGRPIRPSSFSSRYAFVRKKLGIETTFHMLRHDMASRMKGTHIFDLKDIQAQLGHSSIQITMDIYTHIDEEQRREISSWLESGVGKLIGGN